MGGKDLMKRRSHIDEATVNNASKIKYKSETPETNILVHRTFGCSNTAPRNRIGTAPPIRDTPFQTQPNITASRSGRPYSE